MKDNTKTFVTIDVVQYFKLAFRILAGAGGSVVEEAVSSFLPRSQVQISERMEQREAEFSSLLNLSGWETESSLEKDFWIYVIVVFYLGTKHKCCFSTISTFFVTSI